VSHLFCRVLSCGSRPSAVSEILDPQGTFIFFLAYNGLARRDNPTLFLGQSTRMAAALVNRPFRQLWQYLNVERASRSLVQPAREAEPQAKSLGGVSKEQKAEILLTTNFMARPAAAANYFFELRNSRKTRKSKAGARAFPRHSASFVVSERSL
jgi:hypothetical protein